MRFAHINIVALDWENLANFYIKTFGCKIKPPKRELSGAWLDQATGLEDVEIEGIHLILPGYGENGPTLEIFTYADVINNDLKEINRNGFAHIAFEVDDLEAIINRIIESGGAFLGKVVEKSISGAGTIKFAYLRDPEGNIVEIQKWIA